MRRTRLFASTALAALATTLLLGPTAGHATPSTAHVIVSINPVTNSVGTTLTMLNASELLQTGSVTINATPTTINCVAVTSGILPQQHKVYLQSVDTAGTVWHINLVENGATQWMMLTPPGTGPCNTGLSPLLPVTSGSFTTLP